MVWTASQEKAMGERNRTLLVSAAAGSGKTAVLTERIIRSLVDEENPLDITRLLAVTFTKAAAGELRDRIAQKLSERLALDPGNTYLNKQLMLLGGAHISTIDSFYGDIVRTHFTEAGMSPGFRMAEEAELIPLQREAMQETVDEMYAEFPDFSYVADIFCDFRNENALLKVLLEMEETLNRHPDSIHILLRSADEIERCEHAPLDSTFGQIWMRELEQTARRGVDLYLYGMELIAEDKDASALLRAHGPVYTEMGERCAELAAAILKKDFKAICDGITRPFESRMKRLTGDLSPAVQTFREASDEFRTRWKKQIAPMGLISPAEAKAFAPECARVLRTLHRALSRYQTKYTEAKREKEIAEFSDVSRAAYRLLVKEDGHTPTPLAESIAAEFDAVYIDEYQDVDEMQDATFRAISRPRNRFMVGDIKQSIYRFRGAQPAVFAHYRQAFPDLKDACEEDTAASVFMSDCFRCDENVVRFSNAVSGFLFSHHAESIGYTAQDDLHFAKEKPGEDYISPPCRMLLLDSPPRNGDAEKRDRHEMEAKMIANEITRLMREEKKSDGKPILPRDIAVLMRGSGFAKALAKELNARGIPCNDTSQSNFFENPEVLCMYSLLAAIDNPMRDVYLAAALRSPFFGFTLSDLVTVRAAGDSSLSLYQALKAAARGGRLSAALQEKADDVLTRLATYRKKAESLSVDKLLRYLYRETAVSAFSGYEDNEKNTSHRRGNLRRLYEYARTFESGGFKGLYQFIRYVDNIMANNTKMADTEGDPKAVSLITVHHSKGLQFPVCFLANTATAFNTKDTQPAFLSDEDVGCATRLCNAGPFSRTDTFFRNAVALELKRKGREEEMRILYVAMTRAKERLYITAAVPANTSYLALSKKASLAALPYADFLATAGSSYLDWILTALQASPDTDLAEKTVLTDDMVLQTEQETAHDASADVQTAPLREEELHALLQERFAYTYPHAHLTRLPAKMSVSRLSPMVLDVFDNDASPDPTVKLQEETDRLLHTFDRTPFFGKKTADAAARGTATHEFLQFCDLKRAEKDVEAELHRLISERFLSPETAELVRLSELKRFFESAFYRSLSKAKELHRETRFHIFLPAADFTADAAFAAQLEGEKLAVQGVIDLFYTDENGDLILCDYKTDRLTEEEKKDPRKAAKMLTERHGTQLSYYAKALTEICGRAPDKVLIYSLPFGEGLEIDLPQA